MSQLTDRMNAYGMDVAETMGRFVGDEGLYMDCLLEFKDDPGFEKLGLAIQNKEYEQAFENAHMLKGVAGNMGLQPLFDVICKIVEPLRVHDHSDLDAQYAAVMQERENMIKTLL